MIDVPEMTAVDLAFGNIDHLPTKEVIPEQFWRGNTKWNKLVSQWFFQGLDKLAVDQLIAKPGIDKQKALRALQAILKSFEPHHEHKEAGAAFLFSEWFEE